MHNHPSYQIDSDWSNLEERAGDAEPKAGVKPAGVKPAGVKAARLESARLVSGCLMMPTE